MPPEDSSRSSLLIRVGYILLVVLITLGVYMVSPFWALPVALILLTFIATWFVPDKWRRMVRCGHMLFSLGVLLSAAFFLVLSLAIDSGVVSGSEQIDALLRDDLVLALISIAGGTVIAIIFFVVSFLLADDMSATWILALHEVYGVTRKQARRLLATVYLNTAYPYYLVEDGEITKSKPEGLLPRLGGPGKVVIKPYNAVVFERAGETTRIEGPGTVVTKRFEQHKGIVSLRKQWEEFTAENVLTKDHVPLTFHCGVGFRIESEAETDRRLQAQRQSLNGSGFEKLISGRYPVFEKTIYNALYGTTDASWQITSRAATESMLREVVRSYLLEQLYRLEDSALTKETSVLDKIIEQTKEKVAAISHGWGTHIENFVIKVIEVPASVEDQLLGMWAAKYAERSKLIEARAEKETTITQAEGARQAMVARGAGQADALARVERVKAHAVEMLVNQLLRGIREAELTNVGPEVIQRFARVVEQLSSNLVQDDLTALRYVEALENLALSDAPKTIALGNLMLDSRMPPLPRSERDRST